MKIISYDKETLQKMIAGAIYDFSAMLTTLEKPITLSSKDSSDVIIPHIKKFLNDRTINESDPAVNNWRELLKDIDITVRNLYSKHNVLPDGFYWYYLEDNFEDRSLVRLYTDLTTGYRGIGFGVWDGATDIPLCELDPTVKLESCF